MTEHQDHEAKADEVERELDEKDEASDRLQDEIEGTGEDWERKKRDSNVPGAAGMPSESKGPEPESEGSDDDESDDEDDADR